jgi:hypothetical protein
MGERMVRLSGIKLLVLLSGAVLFSVWATPSGATLLTWTDTGTYAPSAGGLNPITYTLEFGAPDSGGIYHGAILTITTGADVTPEWRAGWFSFKFSPNGGTITNLSVPAGWPSWKVGYSTTSLPWNGSTIKPFKNSWAGFYVENVGTNGLLVTDVPGSYAFGFDFTLNPKDTGNVFVDDMPFKVGFYGNSTDQLSEKLVAPVPEPSTLVLLGFGLVTLSIWGRKRFIARS